MEETRQLITYHTRELARLEQKMCDISNLSFHEFIVDQLFLYLDQKDMNRFLNSYIHVGSGKKKYYYWNLKASYSMRYYESMIGANAPCDFALSLRAKMINPGKQLALNFTRGEKKYTKPVDLRYISQINGLSITNIAYIGSFENMHELQVLRLHYSNIRFSGQFYRPLPSCHTMSLINCYNGVQLISPSIRHLTVLNYYNYMNLSLSDIELLPDLDTLTLTISKKCDRYFNFRIPHFTIYSMQCAQRCREHIQNIAPIAIVVSSKRNIQGMLGLGI